MSCCGGAKQMSRPGTSVQATQIDMNSLPSAPVDQAKVYQSGSTQPSKPKRTTV